MDKETKKATASQADAIALAVTTFFEQNPAKNKVYSTADGFLFENVGFAKNHATTIDNKDVTPHTNAANVEVVDEEDLVDDTGTGDDAPPAGAAATQDTKK